MTQLIKQLTSPSFNSHKYLDNSIFFSRDCNLIVRDILDVTFDQNLPLTTHIVNQTMNCCIKIAFEPPSIKN